MNTAQTSPTSTPTTARPPYNFAEALTHRVTRDASLRRRATLDLKDIEQNLSQQEQVENERQKKVATWSPLAQDPVEFIKGSHVKSREQALAGMKQHLALCQSILGEKETQSMTRKLSAFELETLKLRQERGQNLLKSVQRKRNKIEYHTEDKDNPYPFSEVRSRLEQLKGLRRNLDRSTLEMVQSHVPYEKITTLHHEIEEDLTGYKAMLRSYVDEIDSKTPSSPVVTSPSSSKASQTARSSFEQGQDRISTPKQLNTPAENLSGESTPHNSRNSDSNSGHASDGLQKIAPRDIHSSHGSSPVVPEKEKKPHAFKTLLRRAKTTLEKRGLPFTQGQSDLSLSRPLKRIVKPFDFHKRS